MLKIRKAADYSAWRTLAFHPALVAERINTIRGEAARTADPDFLVRPSDGLPAEIRRAIAGEVTAKDRAALKRPRIVLSTPLTREDPHFEQARAAISRRRGRPAGN
ncbi:hypothetical protein NYF14_05375 [Sphingobium sp. 10 DY56-G10]|uniref:hypothetical protein n=1 Tax=Sphingobium sp. 10 DY56-G10 TaxID=2974918 RepID=UPI00352ABDC3